MDKPKRTTVKAENIPQELKELPQWVCWYWKEKDNGWTKPLINPNTDRLVDHGDSTTWGTFQQAFSLYQKRTSIAGVGFVFSSDDPYCGIDVDKCLNADGSFALPIAQEIHNALGSYTEISPSGTGFKVWCKGKLPGPGFNNRKAGNGVEMYDEERYFTVNAN